MRKQENNNDETKEIQAKKMVMWSGIIFFMLLFIFIWSVNTEKIFRSAVSTHVSNDADLTEIKKNFSMFLDEFKDDLDEIKQQEVAISTEKEKEDKEKEIELLKQKLEDSINQK